MAEGELDGSPNFVAFGDILWHFCYGRRVAGAALTLALSHDGRGDMLGG